MTVLPNAHDAFREIHRLVVDDNLPAPCGYQVTAGLQTVVHLWFGRSDELRQWADRLGVDPVHVEGEQGWQFRASGEVARLYVWLLAGSDEQPPRLPVTHGQLSPEKTEWLSKLQLRRQRKDKEMSA